MGNSTANESDPDALESYFTRYSDVPKETILKQHLLSLGHWFSDAALEATAGALVKSYRLFSYDLVPMAELKRNEHRRVPEHFVLLNGPYRMRPVSIQTSLSPYSPYLIDVIDGRLVLTTHGRIVAEVRFPKTPDYYGKSLPDGTPYHEIVAFGSFITIFRNCQYWGAREECKFCDINENARQMKLSRDFTLTAPVKPVPDVVRVCTEVADHARQPRVPRYGEGEGERVWAHIESLSNNRLARRRSAAICSRNASTSGNRRSSLRRWTNDSQTSLPYRSPGSPRTWVSTVAAG